MLLFICPSTILHTMVATVFHSWVLKAPILRIRRFVSFANSSQIKSSSVSYWFYIYTASSIHETRVVSSLM
jgi:hypothetical protein